MVEREWTDFGVEDVKNNTKQITQPRTKNKELHRPGTVSIVMPEQNRSTEMGRGVKGTFPLEVEGWKRLAVVEGGHRWHVFFRDTTPGWHQWKVAAEGRAPRKANFWFSYQDNKPREDRDYVLLREHHPEVFAVVEELRAQLTGEGDLV